MMLSLGIDSLFALFELICVVVEEFVEGKRELIRFKVMTAYAGVGLIYSFGNGFFNLVLIDSYVGFCFTISAVI